jgi:hypothetical protein
MDEHVHEVLKVLRSIDSHLASLVYESTPSRGFAAGIEKAVAQPFINEGEEKNIDDIIIKEVKKALGDK